MSKLDWESRRAEMLVRAAYGEERRALVLQRRAVQQAERARLAALRAGVRREPRTPSRAEICAWLDDVMKQRPDAPWLAA